MHSPLRMFHGRPLFVWLLPFWKLGFRHAKRALKSEPKTESCFYLSDGNHYPLGCRKIELPSSCKPYFRDFTWDHPNKPFVGFIAFGGGGELLAAAVTRSSGAYGRPRRKVGVSVTAVTTSTAIAAVTAATVITAAAATTVTAAAVIVVATAAAVVAAAAVAACSPGVGCFYPEPGVLRRSKGLDEGGGRLRATKAVWDMGCCR